MPKIEFTDKIHPNMDYRKYTSYYKKVLRENRLTVQETRWTYNPIEKSLICTYDVEGKVKMSNILSSLKGDRGMFKVNVDDNGKPKEIVNHLPESVKKYR